MPLDGNWRRYNNEAILYIKEKERKKKAEAKIAVIEQQLAGLKR